MIRKFTMWLLGMSGLEERLKEAEWKADILDRQPGRLEFQQSSIQRKLNNIIPTEFSSTGYISVEVFSTRSDR